MGEIADAMINGELCEHCGVYLGPGNGYPRVCESCAAEKSVDATTREPSKKVICRDDRRGGKWTKKPQL